jgi:hypothetical protein
MRRAGETDDDGGDDDDDVAAEETDELSDDVDVDGRSALGSGTDDEDDEEDDVDAARRRLPRTGSGAPEPRPGVTSGTSSKKPIIAVWLWWFAS